MDYAQIGTMVGAFLGIVSFMLYFPLKRREIIARSENDNVDSLSKVVDRLKAELERKNDRVDILESKQDVLRDRISVLEKEISNNDLAFTALTTCDFYKKNGRCPIVERKNKLKNDESKTKRSIKNGSQKEDVCKKGRNVRGFQKG